MVQVVLTKCDTAETGATWLITQQRPGAPPRLLWLAPEPTFIRDKLVERPSEGAQPEAA